MATRRAHLGVAGGVMLVVLACALLDTAPVTARARVPHAVAQRSGGEHVARWDSAVAIGRDGAVTITDSIDWDFGNVARHGIERSIPTRFRYDQRKKGWDRLTPLDVVSITGSPGTPSGYKVRTSGNDQVIRIGDPNRTITGRHTYTIRYRLRGALNHFRDHDELNLNVVGTGVQVPIDRASASVRAPGTITGVACYTGPFGSQLGCSEASKVGDSAGFSQQSLPAGSAMTVVVGFPVGLVPRPEPILEQRPSLARSFALRPDTVGIAGGLLAAVAGGFTVLFLRAGRDRRFIGSATDVAFGNAGGGDEPAPLRNTDPIPVEFMPPDHLRPGQVGTLIDEQANPLDVTATIVDLAVRGYLEITEVPKEGWLSKPDWELHQLKGVEDLKDYEATLLTGIFSAGPTVRLSELKNHFASKLKDVESLLYDDLVTNGWYAQRPDRTRTHWALLGGAVLAAGVALTALLAATTSYGLIGLPFVVAGLLLFVGARWLPRRTAKGYATLRRVLGFKIFIDESEKDRARFAEQQHLFSEYLPYAVVFGATDKWARAFAGLNGELPQQAWYVGPGPFTVLAFSSAMDSFAVTTSGTISSTPASSGSSGFSGGFSGGGMGGGGAGSW